MYYMPYIITLESVPIMRESPRHSPSPMDGNHGIRTISSPVSVGSSQHSTPAKSTQRLQVFIFLIFFMNFTGFLIL